MSRQNSIAVYHQIEREGLLSKMRWKVYEKLFHHGPATASELASKFPPSVGGRGEAGNVHARLGELVDWGVARVTQERRTCKITSREVQEYDVTANLPKEPVKTRTLLSQKSLKGLRTLYKSLDDPKDKSAVQRAVQLAQEWELRQTAKEAKP